MTEKPLLSEQELLDRINSALEKDWLYPEHHCRVLSLKKVPDTNHNWLAEPANTGGLDHLLKDECDALCLRVLDELASRYDVSWSS